MATLKEKLLTFLGKCETGASSARLTKRFGMTRSQASRLFVALAGLGKAGKIIITKDPDKKRGSIYSLPKRSGYSEKTYKFTVDVPEGSTVAKVWGLDPMEVASLKFEQWWDAHGPINRLAVFGIIPQAVLDFEAQQKGHAATIFRGGYQAAVNGQKKK